MKLFYSTNVLSIESKKEGFMELFKNLIYEYKKGMRDLSLHTCKKSELNEFTTLLEKLNTRYQIVDIADNKVNIFFGNPHCLDILQKFSHKELDKLTPYEDFILGIMLGYSRNEQYQRILSKIA